MSWSSIVGQALAVRLLRQAVQSGRVAHAYLFVGPAGVGKGTVAMELAKTLNCLAPGPDGACDACVSCRKMAASPPTHPDFHLIEPSGRFIKTDQIRELQSEMYARPTEGRHRIAIIDEADRMNPESGNRVLKLLEEPPQHAMFFLLTHNLSGVLPTLISRCQVVQFPPLGTDDVAKALMARWQHEPAQAHLFAALSGGSVGRALDIAGSESFQTRRDESADLLEKLPDMDDFALLQFAEGLEKQKEHLDGWLELYTAWLRDALLMAQTGSEQLIINQDRIAFVRRMASRYGVSALLELLAAVTETRSRLQKNVNTRLALEVLLLRLAQTASRPAAAL